MFPNSFAVNTPARRTHFPCVLHVISGYFWAFITFHLSSGCLSDLNFFFSVFRFVACEKWREEFKTDELPATFNYTEKPEVFKFYPQYYHKIDKVWLLNRSSYLVHRGCTFIDFSSSP